MRISKIVFAVCAGAIAVTSMGFSCGGSRKSAENQAALNSPHSVTLHWNASPGANFYYVYRSSTSQSGYKKIGSSATPTYKDAPVPSGATFYYVVTAVSNKGESKYSHEIKAVVP